ncbi:hypothetical protein G1H11_12790 [Phytoactinopolyspora alkaliphila]|uniref:Uncharacterized protein n=1 Tax=Phytoactinopolyspora alkaliphila TaxID=1783498 RepID=A0A6N9YML2_9ACTN|nr:hypothetical protein [Phytoactinopolyspora alkaliphila]NED96187.1 hypothetical protein [Phytoactinopolyspora alkaliphila]
MGPAEHPFAWFGADRLAELSIFEDTRAIARALFGCIDVLADGGSISAETLGLE